jgi:hypothetical protein
MSDHELMTGRDEFGEDVSGGRGIRALLIGSATLTGADKRIASYGDKQP